MTDKSDSMSASSFPGDDHEYMQSHQRGMSRINIRGLFLKVCRACILSGNLESAEFDRLWDLVEGCSDDKPLQAAYQHLCTLYRKERREWMGVMPEWGDEIFRSEQTRLYTDWMAWWKDKVKIICDEPYLRQACAECFITYDGPRDAAKEEHLLSLIRERFPL